MSYFIQNKFSDLQSLSMAAALQVTEIVKESVEKNGYCSIVLSGGKTPELLYEYLSTPQFAEKIPWGKIYLFWGDERCVPKDHEDSNFYMAYNTLISKVPISESNVYRIITENYPPELIAYSYEKKIKDFFKSIGSKKDKPPPGFDLTLLGIGKDGHTASIFPGCEALKETERWVVPVMAPEGYETRSRITLTLSVINNSQNVLFLVSGREKQAILRDIIDNREKAVKLYPAARVNARSKLYWFVEG